MIITIYVDDLLIYNVEKNTINRVKDASKAKFYMSDLGSISFYLGRVVTQDCENKILCLGPQAYLEKILKNHGMWEYKMVVILIDGSLTLSL